MVRHGSLFQDKKYCTYTHCVTLLVCFRVLRRGRRRRSRPRNGVAPGARGKHVTEDLALRYTHHSVNCFNL